MSRGLGRIEKHILNEVSSRGYCLLKDVEGLQPAVWRSAQSLQRKKLVVVRAFMMLVDDFRLRDDTTRIDIFDNVHRLRSDDSVHHKVTAAFPCGLSDDEINEIRGKNKLGSKDFIEYMGLSPSKRKQYDIQFEKRAKAIAGLIKWYDV